MRTCQYLLVSVLLLSTGCSFGSDHVSERMAVDASIVNAAPVCAGTQPSFTLTGNSPGISHLKTPLPPVVTLERRSDGAVTETGATITDDTHVAVVAQKTLAPGSYNVRVRRQVDNAIALLESALTVLAAPELTAVGGACRAASGPTTLQLTGHGLSAVTLALVASGGSSTALVGTEASETAVNVQLPESVKAEESYTLTATSGAGCTAKRAVTLAAAPTVTGFSVGPKTSKGNIQKQSRLGVVVRGSFAAGTQIVMRAGDSVTPLPATLSAGTLSARASSGFAATGVYAISVDTQGCVAPVGAFRVEDAPAELASALAHVRFSPSASALVAGRIVDVFAGASLGSDVKDVHIDIIVDPAADDFPGEMVGYQTLDKDGRALRTALRMALSTTRTTTRATANSALSVLRVRSSLGEYLLDDAFSVLGGDAEEATSDPRIVRQERDWVRAGQAESIHVEGCDLQGARVVLRRESDGQETPLTAGVVNANDAFTKANFRCTHGSGAARIAATDSVDLTTPSDLPAGIYRLRVYRQTEGAGGGFFDALYPTVLYGDKPTLAGPSGAKFEVSVDAAATLSVSRRGPASAIGSDEEGRKYVYVVGGDSDGTPSMNPASIGAAAPSYEYAPVAPDHTLLPFIQIQGETDHTFPLQSRVGSANATTLAAAYAGALAAAGSQLYLAGGTKIGTTATADVFAAKILTDATPGALAPFSRESTTAQLFGGADCKDKPGTFGASAVISRVEGKRVLVVAGGAIADASTSKRDAITCTSLFTLTDSGGLPDSVKAGGALPSAQAFAASLTDISGSEQTLAFVGGYETIDDTNEYPRPSLALSTTASPFSSAPSRKLLKPDATWNFYQPGLFRAGAALFALGGGYIDSSNLVQKVIDTTLTASAPTAAGTDVTFTAAQSTVLNHTRAAFALSHLPPHAYVHGGVRCRLLDDTCNNTALALATDTEHGLFTP